jgi:hypothetical protein
MSVENHIALVQWMAANHGFLHSDVEVAFDHERGYHARVVAHRSVKAGTCVARCSMTTALSVLNAFHTPPFSSRGTKFPLAFLRHQKPAIIQSFFLMEQWLLQEKSWWAPYILTLPKPGQIDELYFTGGPVDIALLRGTNLEIAMAKQTETWAAQFSKGMEHLKKLQWPNALDRKYTW